MQSLEVEVLRRGPRESDAPRTVPPARFAHAGACVSWGAAGAGNVVRVRGCSPCLVRACAADAAADNDGAVVSLFHSSPLMNSVCNSTNNDPLCLYLTTVYAMYACSTCTSLESHRSCPINEGSYGHPDVLRLL